MKQAILLAGGKGTRLNTLSIDTPKPMVQIFDRPLIQYQVELCKKFGFDDIHILIHYRGNVIREYLGDGRKFDLKITYHKERTLRGTAGAVLEILDKLSDVFLVIYADTFLNVNLEKFYLSHQTNKSDATLFIHPNNHPYDSDLIELDEDGYIKHIHQYPHTSEIWMQNLVNAALYVINKKTLIGDYSLLKINDFAKDLFPKLLDEKKKLFAYISSEYIKDIGTPDRLNDLLLDIKSNKVDKLSSSIKKQAIFLDRDGVLNSEVGHIKRPKELKMIEGVAEGIKKINDNGSLAVIVTNQPVVARGDCSEIELKNINNKLETLLGRDSAYLDAIYYCPHHPESGHKGEISALKIKCNCRKPNTGLLSQATKNMNISLSNSWLIGDTTTDILTAQKFGIKSILLRTGFAGQDYKYSVVPDYTFFDFNSAIDWIVKEHRQTINIMEKYIENIVDKKLLFIGGLARSGKTTWAQIIKEALKVNTTKNIHKINLDSWLIPKNERTKGNVLKRYDMKRINAFIKTINQKQKDKVVVNLPIYDRIKRNHSSKTIKYIIEPRDIVILEGVPALYIEINTSDDFSFYVECNETLRKTRMQVDYRWRKTEVESFNNIYNSREIDESPIIKKSKLRADAIITSKNYNETL